MPQESRRTLEVSEAWAGPPRRDLAAEERLLERAGEGRPALALYSWPEPAVVLGYAQPAADVDLGWCRRSGVPVLRRSTGGTGVVHHRDLSVSLALPAAHPWARGIRRLYDGFLGALATALTDLGAAAVRPDAPAPARGLRERSAICFEDQSADTLAMEGRKVVGCAQARRALAVLVHAEVLLSLDAALYARVFRVDAARVERSLAAVLPGAEPAVVGRRVAETLAAALALDIASVPPPEPPPAALERYGLERWSPVPDSPEPRNFKPEDTVGAVETTRLEGDPYAANSSL